MTGTITKYCTDDNCINLLPNEPVACTRCNEVEYCSEECLRNDHGKGECEKNLLMAELMEKDIKESLLSIEQLRLEHLQIPKVRKESGCHACHTTEKKDNPTVQFKVCSKCRVFFLCGHSRSRFVKLFPNATTF